MINFEYKNPTKILFGKGKIPKVALEIPQDATVLMVYGSGSIKKNGIYEQVKEALRNHTVYEFGGVPANPEYDILLQALALIKEKKVSYLLAVGGGSVIDGVKFLSAAVTYEGDPWDILQLRIRTEEGQGMPFGTILTLPATGSEMNSGYVISRKETNQKLGAGGPGLFPQFSILDPEVVRSIPKKQIANGIVDAYIHVLEQYMTVPSAADLQERFAESILISLQKTAPQLMTAKFDYPAAANFMWCCTMALNGLLQKGVITDWAIHAMGHELTAYYGIDHARTLAIIAPSHYRYNFETKNEKLAQYAERVWGITEGTVEEKAAAGIAQMEYFFHSLDIATKLSDYVTDYQETATRIRETFISRNLTGIGEYQSLTPDDVYEIVNMSY
ncbi:iron-containing alcohol dehydrogenase [Sphingobacterium sp. DN00404]|uniref:Iron-containing alcohol dehydrogenase n=1 Tax=Sphingobacterium micropteri TaxID=2763501 RepID=A0ABR7YR14_9SPHI|nr:iron-containing alcohol dehydrogenase [Sphingobacterium micropteri]MBD1433714.1 iron-containing alcohol dehydrogenase [Sphingobacterium micropteri]